MVTSTCRTQIQAEMKQVKKTMDKSYKSLSQMVDKQTDILTKLLNNTAISQPPFIHMTQSSTPNRHQPSPRPSHVPSMTQPPVTYKRSNTSQNSPRRMNHQQHYQKSGVLTFCYLADEYELRDGSYANNSSTLREINDQRDLVGYYEELQSDAIMYNIFFVF